MELYWRRDEAAISETERRLGGYLMTIARNVLGDKEDAREVVNDTCLAAWNSIPPARPEKLSLFLGKIAREKAIDRLRYASRSPLRGHCPFRSFPSASPPRVTWRRRLT